MGWMAQQWTAGKWLLLFGPTQGRVRPAVETGDGSSDAASDGSVCLSQSAAIKREWKLSQKMGPGVDGR
jgi:hypothetical protein